MVFVVLDVRLLHAEEAWQEAGGKNVHALSLVVYIYSKKYSEAEFEGMVTDNCLIEQKYIESFTTIFKDADRMASGHVGDLH